MLRQMLLTSIAYKGANENQAQTGLLLGTPGGPGLVQQVPQCSAVLIALDNESLPDMEALFKLGIGQKMPLGAGLQKANMPVHTSSASSLAGPSSV